MTPYERLMAEEIPTGTFGGGPYAPPSQPPAAPAEPHTPRWTPTSPADAALHAAEAVAETGAFETGRHARHLHPVPNPTHTAA
ncbi:hypothetical protein [Streptomyces qinglanensis]|uniref:hypothetical protein n=1 Tax=Streptomyces qinglanensis TaxID=943816 RepID=UPI003D750A0B